MRFAEWRAQALCLSLLMATILVVSYLFLDFKLPSFSKTRPIVPHSHLEGGDNNFSTKQHMFRWLVVGIGFGLGTLIKPNVYLHCNHGNRAGVMAFIALLSSNCCLLQVILMALGSAGCAGFAKIAGPIQPLLDRVLGASLCGLWAPVLSPAAGSENMNLCNVWRKVIITIICLALAGSEELLILWRAGHVRGIGLGICKSTLETNVPLEAVILEVDGMGCEACRTKVYKTIQENPFVSAVISVKGGGKGAQGEAVFMLSPLKRNETASCQAESLDLLLDNLGKQGYPSRKRVGPHSMQNFCLEICRRLVMHQPP